MKKILVVDDMSNFREPIAATLRREGYETFCAANGKEALDLISREPPDLILLDVAMPVMNGLECLKVLRANPQTRSIPVLILTAMAEREPVAEAVQVGVQGYLLKSQFALEDMLSKITMLLGSEEESVQPARSAREGDAQEVRQPKAEARLLNRRLKRAANRHLRLGRSPCLR